MSNLRFEGMEETVCCYLIKDNQVLMIYRNKKKRDINHNKWIGLGGHIEEGETPVEAVIRELKEESGLTIINPVKKANIIFNFNGEQYEYMHVFVVKEFKGKLKKNCNEGELAWVNLDELFDLSLWEGDRIFLKPVLNDEPFFEMIMWYQGDKLMKYERIEE